MTVSPTEGGAEAARPGFRVVPAWSTTLGLETRSMRMTEHLELAAKEASTEVRLTTALFGPRR